jgi:hypothetical protein
VETSNWVGRKISCIKVIINWEILEQGLGMKDGSLKKELKMMKEAA